MEEGQTEKLKSKEEVIKYLIKYLNGKHITEQRWQDFIMWLDVQWIEMTKEELIELLIS